MTDLERMYNYLEQALHAWYGRLPLENMLGPDLAKDSQTRTAKANIDDIRKTALALLKKEEYVEGQLRRQSNGRWLLSQHGDLEITSGSVLEIWSGNNWIPITIEHDRAAGGYYATNGMPLKDGDWVRVSRG